MSASRDIDKIVVMRIGIRRTKEFQIPLALLNVTSSIIATALNPADPSQSPRTISTILGDLAISREGMMAFGIFYVFLLKGTLNTAAFIDPNRERDLNCTNSANNGYSFQLSATCLLLGEKLRAPRFVELVLKEIYREFFDSQLCLADLVMIEKLAGSLDGFLFDWASEIENNEEVDHKKQLSNLRRCLDSEPEVRRFLTAKFGKLTWSYPHGRSRSPTAIKTLTFSIKLKH